MELVYRWQWTSRSTAAPSATTSSSWSRPWWRWMVARSRWTSTWHRAAIRTATTRAACCTGASTWRTTTTVMACRCRCGCRSTSCGRSSSTTPRCFHDLHESATYLYTSTGRGPYNAWLDPIVISEWNRLAFKEVQDMTALGVPGVYTFDFYDGWAPNYMFWIANMRNSIGRFYETQAVAQRVELHPDDERGPAVAPAEHAAAAGGLVDPQQREPAAERMLIALREVADNRQEYLQQLLPEEPAQRGEGAARRVRRRTSSPPRPAARPAGALLDLLQRHGVEVHRMTAPRRSGRRHPAGSYVVRMDQPFSRAADMMLDRQYYNPTIRGRTTTPAGPSARSTTPRRFASRTWRCSTPDAAGHAAPSARRAPWNAQGARAFLINYNADNGLTAFRFRHPACACRPRSRPSRPPAAASTRRQLHHPGPGQRRAAWPSSSSAAGREFGFTAVGVSAVPDVAGARGRGAPHRRHAHVADHAAGGVAAARPRPARRPVRLHLGARPCATIRD
jgi:hypothetical protein